MNLQWFEWFGANQQRLKLETNYGEFCYDECKNLHKTAFYKSYFKMYTDHNSHTRILSRCRSPSPNTNPMMLIAAEECVNLCTVFHQWIGDVLEHLWMFVTSRVTMVTSRVTKVTSRVNMVASRDTMVKSRDKVMLLVMMGHGTNHNSFESKSDGVSLVSCFNTSNRTSVGHSDRGSFSFRFNLLITECTWQIWRRHISKFSVEIAMMTS